VTQLLVVETSHFGNISQLLFHWGLFVLRWVLIPFPFFGPLVVYIMFPIIMFIVSCKTCGVLTFLCMDSSSMHSATFIISRQVARFAKWCCEPKATSHEGRPLSTHIPLSLKWDLIGTWRFGHTSPSLQVHWIGASLKVLAHPLGFGCGEWTSCSI
jgi:hypothetical protein